MRVFPKPKTSFWIDMVSNWHTVIWLSLFLLWSVFFAGNTQRLFPTSDLFLNTVHSPGICYADEFPRQPAHKRDGQVVGWCKLRHRNGLTLVDTLPRQHFHSQEAVALHVDIKANHTTQFFLGILTLVISLTHKKDIKLQKRITIYCFNSSMPK